MVSSVQASKCGTETSREEATDQARQTVALERIADSLDELLEQLGPLRDILKRVGHRLGRGGD